jgi:hypothetical protein
MESPWLGREKDGMGTYRRMRASDEDREQAAAVLADAFVAGRLAREELDERCAAAYAARTWGELDDLTADLPAVLPAARLEALPPSGTIVPPGAPRPDHPRPLWPLLAFALALGAILGSMAESAVAWTAAVLIPLTLLPLALGGAWRMRRRP